MAYLFISPLSGGGSQAVPLRIIVVSTPEQADEILKRLHAGADFAQLARQLSIHETASDGGYLGQIDPESLRSELREALSGKRPGALTAVVKLPEGYAILQVLDQPPGGTTAAPANIESNQAGTLPLAARGTVRFSADVSGYPETLLARRTRFLSTPGWQENMHAACDARLLGVPELVEKIQAMVTDAPTSRDLEMRLYTLGELYASDGKMNEAIQAWESSYQSAAANQRVTTSRLAVVLATAYLHRASIGKRENQNGIDRSHLFPAIPGALHPNEGDVEKAIALYTKVLNDQPDDYEAIWLLNLAYMTNRGYPDKVPARFLIPPAKLQSQQNIGRFLDVAPSAGIDIPTMAGGMIVDDFDNDGLLDMVVSQMDDCAPVHFFRNNGDGTFSDRSEASGLSKQLGGLNMIQADYNNDGCTDILLLRGGWEFPRRLSLLRNNCDGTFTDVTVESGLGRIPTATQTAVWTDIDNDGNLDLFVGNENAPSQLFLNQGDGTFVDIAHQAGVDRSAYTKAVVAADYDNDGYPDIYVSNNDGANFLYRNNGDRTFTEVGEKAHVQEPWKSFGAAFFDYDNDGLPDLFVASYYNSTDEFARGVLGLPRNAEGNKLYRNLGNGVFEDVSAQVGLDRVMMPMGLNFGDVDNDGFLDLYLGNGNPSYASRVPNVLLRNHAGKRFVDISASSGTGAMEKGHGIAFADLTNSGHEDIALVMGGAIPGDRHAVRLFEHPPNNNDWLTLHLIGVKTNRSAIGARIKVTVQNGSEKRRNIYRTVGSGGSFGASPLEQHIGVGKSAKVDHLEIWWPTSRTRQQFSDVAVNQAIEIREFAKTYRKLERKRFDFRK